MSKKAPKQTKRFVYQGVRLARDHKLVNVFAELDDQYEMLDEGELKKWAVGRGEHFIIGQAYKFPCNDEYEALLGSAEALDVCPPVAWSEDKLKLWSLRDSEARSSRESKLAEARAVKKYRVGWQYGLEPLRNLYASADYYERQTLLRMMREYLEKGVG